MLLSQNEFNILRTAGFYKDLPANLSSELGGDTLKELIEMKLLRLNRSKTACRLTRAGVELLSGAGYCFDMDKHPIGDGDLLNRRLQSSEIALAFQRIGVDVFSTDTPQNKSVPCYLSAYALRRSACANVLGMAKFSGYFYTTDDIFVIYHLGSKLSGFYPTTESDIFFRESMLLNKNVKIVFIGGRDYNEMFSLLNRKKEKAKRNDSSFNNAIDELSYNVSILPLNLTGLRVLRIISIPNYEERLQQILFDISKRHNTPLTGLVLNEDEGFQINIDNDIRKLKKFCDFYSNVYVCYPLEQEGILPKEFHNEKLSKFSINLKTAEQLLGLNKFIDYDSIAYTDENGIGIAFERKGRLNA